MDQQDKELQKLQQQLAETIKAEGFFESESGRLWQDLVTREINRLVKDITSDKYVKDHQGYVNATIELGCYRKMLRTMQVAASPIRRKKLEERLNGPEQ